MRSIFFFILMLAAAIQMKAQHQLTCVVKDSADHEPIPGAVISVKGSNLAVTTGANGKAILTNIPDGEQRISVSFLGYAEKTFSMHFPLSTSQEFVVLLSADQSELEEVIVSTTRTNARIEDLPVKVEVLGQDDMDEESTIVPGGVGSILGDLSVITIQKTNPVNGNDAVRMQGLDYKYTQLLRDGLPLYDGFSGSLGVLAIPPLDLKQVEIVKGSASTLYGGGAIGGLINFISRTPTDSPAVTLTFNRTSLNESNINTFISKKNNKIGTTLFAGANYKQAYDVNGDGFAEVPEQKNFIIHPRLFFYPDKKTSADAGITLTSDVRRGGDMYAIRYKQDTTHAFLFNEKVLRTTIDGHVSRQLNEDNLLSFKTTGSLFDRSLYYAGFNFSGRQVSSYSELNNLYKTSRHNWVSGVNVLTEQFQKQQGDTVHFNSYNYQTIGIFSQEDWQLTKKLSLEAGIRADYHSRYQWFILPRAGLFYRPAGNLSIRLHYGSGYKIPNLFTSTQPGDLLRLTAISSSVKPERSNGLNMDINYNLLIRGRFSIQLNQAFYYTLIDHPTIMQTDSAGTNFISNAPYTVSSIGTDTYLRFKLKGWELYLGYNHTEARQTGSGIDFNMPFNPKDKFAATLAFEVEKKWRMGVEAAYNANQYIYNNARVPNYWFFAGMIERKFKFGSLVLNCENIGNYRQSDYQPLVSGTRRSPVFASIWGPVEGRVINLSLKISL